MMKNKSCCSTLREDIVRSQRNPETHEVVVVKTFFHETVNPEFQSVSRTFNGFLGKLEVNFIDDHKSSAACILYFTTENQPLGMAWCYDLVPGEPPVSPQGKRVRTWFVDGQIAASLDPDSELCVDINRAIEILTGEKNQNPFNVIPME